MGVIGAVLAAAVWWQRGTIGDAVDEMAAMSGGVIVVLVVLTLAERIVRADLMRRLLGRVSFWRGVVVHDVGAAADKGVPLGGPLAAGLRWSISREAGVDTPRIAGALIAYGVFAGFSLWGLPAAWLTAEIVAGSAGRPEVIALVVCVAVLAGMVAMWSLLLWSEPTAGWIVRRVERVWHAFGRRVLWARRFDPATGLLRTRDALRLLSGAWTGSMSRIVVAQGLSGMVLVVALLGLGGGDEMGVIEMARIYFLVTLVVAFVPVPGGIGVVEAGMTAALVDGGLDTTTALAGVLVYRLFTYVLPIASGTILYAGWRLTRRARHRPGRSPTDTSIRDEVAPDATSDVVASGR